MASGVTNTVFSEPLLEEGERDGYMKHGGMEYGSIRVVSRWSLVVSIKAGKIRNSGVRGGEGAIRESGGTGVKKLFLLSIPREVILSIIYNIFDLFAKNIYNSAVRW